MPPFLEARLPEILAAAAGLAAGAVLVWAVLGRRIAGLRALLGVRSAELAAERAARDRERALQAQFAAEREKTVQAQLRGMLAEVENVTAAALERRERTLAARNAEQVRGLLAPMHAKLDDFRRAAEDSRKANGDLGVRIGEFLRGIQATSASFGQQAKSFTDALAGANKKQGNWGEAILGRMLSDCGLREGEGYFLQKGTGGGIPDCQVADPAGRKLLVIDAKMSWTKYEEAYRLPAGEERRAALREHVASVKRHIDELARKDYPGRLVPCVAGYGYVPLTAMFVPCNAALEAALEEDPGLMDYALKHDVALVTPLTLFGFLALVSRAWSRYAVDRNGVRIYDEAKKLVGCVDGLFRHLEDLGDALRKAGERYEAVLNLARIDPAGQCIKAPAMRILKLGARPDRGLRSRTMAEGDGLAGGPDSED